ncbi:TMEM165/GDT1 family protein [Caloramator sp. mosi_1]|uniref:TMEM165/GDT1 family protein n=1 Tax=Caloramator sp. mosi_1 TaxID=3023090 RepID=UPI00235F31E1|nr:TMEM165/GDT1 family protein [Caloramator sp. mosi_1]WDC83664.1 TMEM165/GDT1 family protein [Caloramator sp. mosi_1]
MALLKAFLFVLVAEMGDKTQLLAMACASKYKLKQVIAGVFTAILLLNALAVLVGTYLGSYIKFEYVKLAAALLFIGFGLWGLKEKEEEENIEEEACSLKEDRFGPIITVATTFFLAELGDKTQIMTLTFAAQEKAPILVLIGASLGMMVADTLGIVGGTLISKYLPEKFIKLGAAVIFIVFGVLTLYEALPAKYLTALYQIIFYAILILLVYLIGFRRKKKSNLV